MQSFIVFFSLQTECLGSNGPADMWLQWGWITMAPGEALLVAKANFIAEKLFQHCVVPDSGKRLRETGSISPASTLKNKEARAAFEWAATVNTQKKNISPLLRVEWLLEKLFQMKGVDIPVVPHLPVDMWVEIQAKTICHLCQRCRRNSGSQLRFRGYRQRCSMDFQETLPLEVGSGDHQC